MALSKLINRAGLQSLREWLLTDYPVGISVPLRYLHRGLRIVYAIGQDLKNGQLSMRAMSLVYTTVIAIVPLLALSFSVLKGFGMHESLKPILLDAMQDLGEKRFEIVDNVMTFINNVNVGVLGAVGFAVLIYSVIAMMHKIEHAFNYTWQIARARSVSHRIRDYLSVVFVAPLLLIISAVLTGSSRFTSVIEFIQSLPLGGLLMTMASFVLPYFLMCVGFAFVYLFIPNTRVKVSSALLGGLVTTLVWKLLGWGVANFVAGSASNTAIYSAFASVIILMVWLYFCWFALLIGASVAFYHQNYHAQSVGRVNIKLALADEEILALEIMRIAAVRFAASDLEQGHHPTVADIAVELGVSEIIVDRTVELLVENGFLMVAGEDHSRLLPQRPLGSIILSDLVETVRKQVHSSSVMARVKASDSVSALYNKVEAQQHAMLQDVSLEQLIQRST